MSESLLSEESACKQILHTVTALILKECGFTQVSPGALKNLTVLLQRILEEAGAGARLYAELAGRSEALYADVLLCLRDIGLSVDAVPEYTRRDHVVLGPPMVTPTQMPSRSLQPGADRKARPTYIPDYLPTLPPAHTYQTTPTYRPAASDYAAARSHAAEERQHTQEALTQLLARLEDTYSLFPDVDMSTVDMELRDSGYRLLANVLEPRPYLRALLGEELGIGEENMANSDTATATSRQQDSSDAVQPSDNPYLRKPKFPPLTDFAPSLDD